MSRWNNESLVATLWCCLVIGCACSSCVCQICESEYSEYLIILCDGEYFMRLLVRLTSSFDFGAGQSTRCGLAVLKVLQGSRSIGAIFGQANQNRGEVQGKTHFPRTSPILHVRVCFGGGDVNNFPSWLSSTGGKKFPLGDACHVPQSDHRKIQFKSKIPCVSIILRPLITALPALSGSPVTGISHE